MKKLLSALLCAVALTAHAQITTVNGRPYVQNPIIGGNVTFMYPTTLSNVDIRQATTSQYGEVKLAQASDAIAGNDASLVVTPSALAGATQVPVYAVVHMRDKLSKMTSGTTAQLKVMTWGDSVGNLQMAYVTSAMAAAYGDLGTGSNPTTATAGDVITPDGSTVAYNYTYHWTGSYYDVGSGGSATFGRGGGAARSDSIHVYYVKEAGAGTFKVQTAVGNGAFADEAGYTNVSASSASGLQLGIITLSKSVGFYQVKVVGLTGRVKFYFPYFADSTDSGIIQIHSERGGLALSDANTMDSGLFNALMADLAPDVATFQMKEGSTYNTDLPTHISRFQTALPSTDWVYLLTTPDASDTSQYGSIWQNTITRIDAAAAGYAVIDLRSPCINYTIASNLGWIPDGTHPNNVCNQMLAYKVIAPALHIAAADQSPISNPLINASVKTQSLAVSNSYATSSQPGLTPAVTLTPTSDLDGTLNAQRNLTVSAGTGGVTVTAPTVTIAGNAPNAAITFNTPSGYVQFNQTISLASALNQTAGGTVATFGNSQNNNYITVSRTGSGAASVQVGAFTSQPFVNFTGGPLTFEYNGSAVATLDQSGVFSPNAAKLHSYTVATLPASPSAGYTVYVTDSNATLTAGAGAVVAGGGSNIVPVFYDGSNWRIY